MVYDMVCETNLSGLINFLQVSKVMILARTSIFSLYWGGNNIHKFSLVFRDTHQHSCLHEYCTKYNRIQCKTFEEALIVYRNQSHG